MKPVHLVLDTSAVVAYATGSEHVGEPLTQVTENDAVFTAPLTVFATAATRADRVWIDLLTKHPAFEPVETDWTRWTALAATLGLVGRLDAAQALLVALDFDCDVLTAEPGRYAAWVTTHRSSPSDGGGRPLRWRADGREAGGAARVRTPTCRGPQAPRS